MRSWRLATEAARLERADREEEGLMPAMALVTVERLSWRWLSSAPLVPLLFSKSDTSTGGEGEGRDGRKTQGQEEGREREKEDRDKKSCWEKKKKVARRKAKIKRKRQSIGRAGQQQGTAPMPRPRPGTGVGSSTWEPFLAHGGALWQHRVPELPLSSTQSCPEQELPYLQYALAICPSVRNAVLAPRSRSEQEMGQGHTLPVAAQPTAVGTQPPAARAGAGCRLPAGCSQPLPLPNTDRSGSLTWGPLLLGDSQLLMENKSPITSWSPPASNSSCSSDAPRMALSRTGH